MAFAEWRADHAVPEPEHAAEVLAEHLSVLEAPPEQQAGAGTAA
jgi:hypothetical protein